MKKHFLLGIAGILIAALAATGCHKNTNDSSSLTFELGVENITENGADLKVIPSDKSLPYFSDVVLADSLENLSDEEIITHILASSNPQKTGDQYLYAKDMSLTPETRYMLYALGVSEDQNLTSKVEKLIFKTAVSSIAYPEFEIHGKSGDETGDHQESALTFSLKSDTAEQLSVYFASTDEISAKVSGGMSKEELLEAEGTVIDDANVLTLLNQEGYSLTYSELTDNVSYTLLASVKNERGIVMEECSVTTEAIPLTNPEIEIEGSIGDENGEHKESQINFEIKCSSKDASEAEIFIVATADIELALNDGFTLENIVDANEGIVLTPEEIDAMNQTSYQIHLGSTDGVKADTGYTCLVNVSNPSGGRSVVRSDVKTEEAGVDMTNPVVEVTGQAGDEEGKDPSSTLTFFTSCSSKDASYAEAFISDKAFLDGIISDSYTLEDLMKDNKGIGKVFSENMIETFNTSTLKLQWKENASNTEYSVLIYVENLSGGFTVARCDVKTAAE